MRPPVPTLHTSAHIAVGYLAAFAEYHSVHIDTAEALCVVVVAVDVGNRAGIVVGSFDRGHLPVGAVVAVADSAVPGGSYTDKAESIQYFDPYFDEEAFGCNPVEDWEEHSLKQVEQAEIGAFSVHHRSLPKNHRSLRHSNKRANWAIQTPFRHLCQCLHQ